MSRTFLPAAIAIACLAAIGSAQQQRAADGVALNDEGTPQYSTFSLCAIDPSTGQFIGNYPQAFSHIGVIASGVTLARARAGALA